MAENREMLREHVQLVRARLYPLIRVDRFPEVDRLITRFEGIVGDWEAGRLRDASAIVECNNEICVAIELLGQKLTAHLSLAYEPAVTLTGQSIDFLMSYGDQQHYFDVKTIAPRDPEDAKSKWDRRSDVISLRRLIKEIDNNLHLFTRENYVAHDGRPYDYETVERQKMLEILAAGGGAFWAEREGPKAYTPAKMLHSAFDKIWSSTGGTRNRTDRMSPK